MSLVAERVITDDWKPYDGIDATGVKHECVNHKAKQYVRDGAFTPTVSRMSGHFSKDQSLACFITSARSTWIAILTN
jgi:hypothetical protein